MISQVIDYRNAKYQGQTLNGLPHGIGIIFDYKNLFTLAEWSHGEINGKCLIVFGDSKIFYGSIKNRFPDGICTYHLKDKCQVFCNFHQNSPNNASSKNQQQNDTKSNILVALLPAFNMIIKVVGQREEQLIIQDEQVYKKNDIESRGKILQKMLGYRFQQNELDAYLSLEGFVKKMFTQKKQYQAFLDTVHLTSSDGGKELFFTLRTRSNQSSLGIKIQNCMQEPNTMTNLHNDGHSYIVKAVGMFGKQGLLQFGLKNIRTLIKGNIKQQAIYSNEKSIIRYQNESLRPKQCALQILNHLKSSPNFINKYMPTKHLYILQAECLNVNFNIKETQTKKFAQLILQNPKEFTLQEREKIEKVRNKRNNDGGEKKGVSDSPSKSPYNKRNEKYQKESEQILLAKQDIYRSVSKKKLHGTSSSPYAHAGTGVSNSPQKQIKPAQLTNVKPILQLYKNTADNSFYNSITKNPQGYQFSIAKNVESKNINDFDMRTPDTKHENYSMSADYIKSLQNRRRLYQESDLNHHRMPMSVVEKGYNNNHHQYSNNGNNNNNMSRKKFHYLPDQSQEISSHPVTHSKPISSHQKHTLFSRYGETNDNDISSNTLSSFNNNNDLYAPREDNYFRSKQKEVDRSLSKQRRDDSQVGKLGRRVRPTQTQNVPFQTSNNNHNRSQKKLNPYEPIIVPQFKISHTKIVNQDYNNRPIINVGLGSNQNREQSVKVPANQQRQIRKSPLKQSQNYRKEYLQTNSPIRRLQSLAFGNSDNYRNGAQQMNARDNINERSKSPQQLSKRKKILTDNPFGM